MRYLYTLLLYLMVPWVVIRIIKRGIRMPSYFSRFPERFGKYSLFKSPENSIWIHAVSVGEVQAAAPLINQLLKKYPLHSFVVTTVTPTGEQRVRELFGKKVTHFYLPYDLPGSVRRFLDVIDPEVAIIVETELWPNLFHQLGKRQVPVVVANARMSERSYLRYKRFSSFTRSILENVTLVAAQGEADAERFYNLSSKDRAGSKLPIVTTGSLKFDLKLPASLYEHAEVLRYKFGMHRPIWIAASTHEGEDEQVLAAFSQVIEKLPNSLLILVPRHPERSSRVASLCKKAGYQCVRRSKTEQVEDSVQVYIGDTLGEMSLLYAISDVAFVGGSLVKTGGHNILEPAALGIPVITGPHTFNFAEITKMMLKVNAAEQIRSSEQLAKVVLSYLRDANLRHNVGQNGKQLIKDNRGALEKLLKIIDDFIEEHTSLEQGSESAGSDHAK